MMMFTCTLSWCQGNKIFAIQVKSIAHGKSKKRFHRAFIVERKARSTKIWWPTCGSGSGAQGTAETACWDRLPGNCKSTWACEGKKSSWRKIRKQRVPKLQNCGETRLKKAKSDDFEDKCKPFKRQFRWQAQGIVAFNGEIPSCKPPARKFRHVTWLFCTCGA